MTPGLSQADGWSTLFSSYWCAIATGDRPHHLEEKRVRPGEIGV